MSKIDWKNLKFEYSETNCHIRATWRNGEWSELEAVNGNSINLHIAASALHYGQSAFEGLKAFGGKDGRPRIFRPQENAARLQASARRVCMPEVPTQMFLDACDMVVKENSDFLPPYGTGASMYLRPLLFGSGQVMGVSPAQEYTFILLCMPVGAYYQGGLQSVEAMVVDGYDRAAPLGVGNVKVAGNYASGMLPGNIAKKEGYPVALYLDAKEHKYIDEFATSNFIAINDGKYITPSSATILPSITNRSLMQLAEDIGLVVERRPIELEEVTGFEGAAACGTAVVLTPVSKIHTSRKDYTVGDGSIHPKFQELYDLMQGIQFGEIEDKHNWVHIVE